ncbi:protein-S-isoprenylcysteine O-methyltransferase [Coccinella septempunctata]|uniref:protein-S-isoprenylcysteine O-methyltransferase n=1 Tax=Coccinella septempunctata TaxID=41139 RepID=UPI001D08E827|nr:protein-S-isoprenylcysteine O-methyltransferase [Coccinella septempunctata]
MILSREANVALVSFIGSCAIFLSIAFLNLWYGISFLLSNIFIFTCSSIFIFISINLIYKEYDYQIAIRASFLGCVFAIGTYVKLGTPPNYENFGVYMCIMSIFHYSEFLVLALISPKLVSTNSFVINHSPEYIFAATFSWIEFFTETYFWPSLKSYFIISYFGCAICIAGELLRKTAMLNAGTNFNHLVQYEKAEDHVLVTSGVYSLFRHPSYVGWFYWSIGTQIILLNPISIIGYTIASWMFFKQRIFIEEITLLNFFGQQYCDYQNKVGTGLPFIRGHLI